MPDVDPLFATVPALIPTDAEIDQVTATTDGYASVTDKLLASHKTSQLGAMGDNLNQLLVVAKGLNPTHAQHSFFGRVMTMLHGEREQLLAHTQSVKTRLDSLVSIINQSATLQRQRIVDLDGLKSENSNHLDRLSAGIAKLTDWEVLVDAAIPAVDPAGLHASINLAALKRTKQRLLTTIENLKNACELDKQQGLELQATQDNARALLDEFALAVNIAVPALVGLVAQQLIAIEQHNAAETDHELRNMVASAITQAAQTLGDNQVQIATMQNRPIVTMDDLEQCQTILEQSAAKVKAIETQGAADRASNAQRRADLERRFLA